MEKIYNKSNEVMELANKIKQRYYLYVGQVDLENVFFAEIDGEKPKRAGIMEVSGVSSSWVRYILDQNHNALYCMAVWGQEWLDLAPNVKEWLVFDALLRIDPENTGKIRKPDINEFGMILDYFGNIGIGAYWRNKSDKLPSLLGGIDPLPIPLPPDDTDEGSSI